MDLTSDNSEIIVSKPKRRRRSVLVARPLDADDQDALQSSHLRISVNVTSGPPTPQQSPLNSPTAVKEKDGSDVLLLPATMVNSTLTKSCSFSNHDGALAAAAASRQGGEDADFSPLDQSVAFRPGEHYFNQDGVEMIVERHEIDETASEQQAHDYADLPDSLFIFTGTNKFRVFCLELIATSYFQNFILIVIVLNSIFLAMDQPAVSNPPELNMFLIVADYICNVIFILEMCVKIVALGFVLHDHAYLRNPWNRLDFIIVIGSIINVIMDFVGESGASGFTAIRVIRVLRPLRSVSRIKNLKLLIAGLFQALPQVVDNLLLFLFIVVVFAIAAVQLWAGRLSSRCYITEFPPGSNATVEYVNFTTPHLQQDDDLNCGGTHTCALLPNMTVACEQHPEIYQRRNMNYENFFTSSLQVFKVMVFDNWPDDLNAAMNFAGFEAAIFFVILTLIGGYCCVNLFLAVLTQGYSQTAHMMQEAESHEKVDGETQCDLDAEEAEAKRQKETAAVPTEGEFGVAVDVEIGELKQITSVTESPRNREGGTSSNQLEKDDTGSNDGSFHLDADPESRHPARQYVGFFVSHKITEIFMMVITALNVVVLAIDHYGIDPETENALIIIGHVCTGLFTIEIVLKLLAFGMIKTLSNGFNVLDFILVLVAYITLAISGGNESNAFSAFRALRILRIFRLLSKFESLQTIIEGILQSVASIGYLSLLILLFLYIFAILGMQLFGVSYGINDLDELRDPHDSFGTIWQSAILAFIVMTGDSWTDKMRVTMMGFSGGWEWVPVAYFVVLYMIGNYILINLSVAIIVDKLQETMDFLDAKRDNELHPPMLFLPRILPGGEKDKKKDKRRSLRTVSFRDVIAPRTDLDAQRVDDVLREGTVVEEDDGDEEPPEEPLSPQQKRQKSEYVDKLKETETGASATLKRAWMFVKAQFVAQEVFTEGDSLNIFTRENPLRRLCLYFYGLPAFNHFIFFCIVANVMFLAFDRPYLGETGDTIMFATDIAFAVIFLLELIIKVIAVGAIFPKRSEEDEANLDKDELFEQGYFRDSWNCVDAFVTLVSVIALFVPIFKVLRSLRTVRIVVRVDSTKIILVALFEAVPHVMHGMLLALVLFLVFGILGTQLYKGQLYYCNDLSIATRAECIGTYETEVSGPVYPTYETVPRQWVNSRYHFDHLGHAMISLFVVMVGDGWSNLMYVGMDVVGEGVSLRLNASPWNSLYFIMVFIAGNFFALNMMIGILINYFSKKKKMYDGSALLTAQQRLFVKAREIIDETVQEDDAKPLENEFSEKLYKILKKPFVVKRKSGPSKSTEKKVENANDEPETAEENSEPRWAPAMPIFDFVMLIVILINVTAVAMEYYRMDWAYEQTLAIIQLICLCIFAVEMILKLLASGHRYFAMPWNQFDSLIVFVGFLALGLPQIKFLAFLRVLRVIKVIRGTGVEQLITKLLRSFASLVNVVAILLLTYFVFAVAGVALFGKVKLNGSLNNNNNFRSVPNAMLVLYQSATTENWDGIMEACAVQPPNCDPALDECGDLIVARVFFLSYMTACAFIALQLFVAVIVEIFSEDDDDDPVKNAFKDLKEIWRDHYGDDAIHVNFHEFIEMVPKFPRALTDLEPNYTRADVMRLLASLPIPVDSRHRIYYRDVVYAMAHKKYHVDTRTMGNLIGEAMTTMFIGTAFSVSQMYAVHVIIDLWHNYKTRIAEDKAALEAETTAAEAAVGGSSLSCSQPMQSPSTARPSTVSGACSIESVGESPPTTDALSVS